SRAELGFDFQTLGKLAVGIRLGVSALRGRAGRHSTGHETAPSDGKVPQFRGQDPRILNKITLNKYRRLRPVCENAKATIHSARGEPPALPGILDIVVVGFSYHNLLW